MNNHYMQNRLRAEVTLMLMYLRMDIENGQTVYSISKATGISQTTLAKILNEEIKLENVTYRTAYYLREYLENTLFYETP